MTIHPDRRSELAARLRALRTPEGKKPVMKTRALAAALGWSQSKVSRVERGVTLAKPGEVDAWAEALDAPDDVRRELVAIAEHAAVRLTEWRREVAVGRRRVQAEIGEMQSTASVVREFSDDVLPGLAQSRDYARIMFLLGQHEPLGDEDVDSIVDVRMANQDVLDDTSKKFLMLCTEAAFHRSLLPRDQMLDQVERVLAVARRPNVEFGVIPFSVREREQTYHAFAVIGDPKRDHGAIVLAETVTRGLTIRDPDDVAGYIDHYNRLAEGAVNGDALPEYLGRVAAAAPWNI